MNFSRVSVCVWAMCVVLCAFALAQEEPQAASSAAVASVPRLIRINGSVPDEAGNPRNGNVGVTFTLYNDEGGQVPVWQESQNVKLDASGRYNALLGASNECGFAAGDFLRGPKRDGLGFVLRVKRSSREFSSSAWPTR